MIIIELDGLPGSGKSTTVNEAIQTLNKSFLLRSELLKWPLPKKSFRFLALKLRIWANLFVHFALIKMPQKTTYFRRLVDLLLRIYFFCYNEPDDKTLLLDEGIVQYLSSLAYDKSIFLHFGLNRLIKRVFRDFNITVVYCIIPLTESAKRIKNRNRPGDRYNVENEDRQSYLLQKKKDNIEAILKLFPGKVYEMNMTMNQNENAETLAGILAEHA